MVIYANHKFVLLELAFASDISLVLHMAGAGKPGLSESYLYHWSELIIAMYEPS